MGETIAHKLIRTHLVSGDMSVPGSEIGLRHAPRSSEFFNFISDVDHGIPPFAHQLYKNNVHNW